MQHLSALSIKASGSNKHGYVQDPFATCKVSWGCLHCSKYVSFTLAMNSISDRDRPMCKGRTVTGSHTPAWGLSAYEEIAKCNLPEQLTHHFRLLVQPGVF